MASNDPFDQTPSGFPDIIRDLHTKVVQAQPKDLYQFCGDYFNHKLEEQRAELLCLEEMLEVSDEEVYTSGAEDYATSSQHTLSTLGDDSEEEDIVGELQHIPPALNRVRRTSVSAESMEPTDNGEYLKMVVEKTAAQRERIESSISNNFLFKNLDEEQKKDAVDAMAEKKIFQGEEVIKQGGIGDYFYIVESGSLDCYVEKEGDVEPLKVTDFEPGASFGELALMYNAPRAATIVATSDCVLWALDRVTFRRMLMERTNSKRKMYEHFLEEVPLLASLESYEKHKIADALETLVFEDGEVVIRQGDIGQNFYIIEAGEAIVTKADASNFASQISVLTKGDYFGELALLNNKPRAATIVASGKLKVVTLGKRAFVRLLGPVVDIIRRNTANYRVISRQVT
ncbi:camp-dependent protein kinase regulatory subunit [Basidiobolus meristosporus CBS 931.73]|uniref:cAMP-dependent protein kinase regulatory subunit n=1 Tax=Basidiobolus meristosporus CBS 931.73 TaxID=1314790 RepID=A0A1Y1YCD0_9FUNG|nr:camp-dependent protein kinase regulatory subunit [Basidiobolus meristosporus CBS 931.73]|eukprot:ORX95649.1 camp-dependent protein kinase regulatory subunit [Basidiobolus meristosporus CBS 931.73]